MWLIPNSWSSCRHFSISNKMKWSSFTFSFSKDSITIASLCACVDSNCMLLSQQGIFMHLNFFHLADTHNCNHTWYCYIMLLRYAIFWRYTVIYMMWLIYLHLFQECANPPHIHPTSRHITASDEFFQALSYVNVSTASDKCWGEKAWVWG